MPPFPRPIQHSRTMSSTVYSCIPPMPLQALQSSPSQAIKSSPPVGAHNSLHGTPSHPRHVRSSSGPSQSRKRNLAAMDDSGYFSSLESSVMRTNKASRHLGSEIDIAPPRLKHGRAEEEIARLRSSSHDPSPTRLRTSKGSYLVTDVPDISSSPIRQEDHPSLLPPLTPAVTFKKPMKPPPSVSPNTNLRNHRRKIQDLIGTPAKSMGNLGENLSWSPAFILGDDLTDAPPTINDSFNTHFNIFADEAEDFAVISLSNYASPIKRSAKRPQLDRANTTASILADITGSTTNTSTLMNTPSLKAPRLKSSTLSKSPSKSPDFCEFPFGLTARRSLRIRHVCQREPRRRGWSGYPARLPEDWRYK